MLFRSENIVSNCDCQVFLGSQAIKTCEYISKSLGDATISKKTESISKALDTTMSGIFGINTGNAPNVTHGDQTMARTLMTVDELKRLDLWTEVILIKGAKPVKCRKYDISQHPKNKEAEANAVSHNELKVNDRAEWRIYNPYEQEAPAADQKEEISEAELEARFNELFNIS